MKTKLVLGGLLALTLLSHAQSPWTTSGTDIYNSNTGNVGIGTTTPAQKLDVRGGALQVINTSYLGYSFLGRDANPGNDSYFYHRMTTNFHILGGSKNGTGTMRKLGFAIGGGDLEADVKMTITPNGDVGIGTTSPGAKLEVYSDVSPTSAGTDYYGALSNINLTAFGYDWSYALAGKITSGSVYHNYSVGVYGSVTAPGNLYSRGVYGEATGGESNVAGSFSSITNVEGGTSMGVETYANGTDVDSYGLYSSGSVSGSGTAWAGYFQGNVYRSGTDNFTSDQKLKNDIKPLERALDKIVLLKPSSYTFKTDEEYKAMNLPKGKQMGLIAQDLEKVFPELVTEMHEINRLGADGKTYKIPAFKSVQYISLIPVLIAGVQEQQKQIEEQTKTNEELKNLVAIQQQQINELLERSSNPTGLNSLNGMMEGFSMDQNIPNPFSQETVVRYSLPQNIGNAYMNIYDLSGKQITSFALNQRGASSLTITSEKLAAGIYIYSIVADGKVMDSKRMVVAEKH